jgi:alcohol dehydrogenase (cytochrome c)
MITRRISGKILVASILLVASFESQSLKSSKLMELPTDTWPMYNGDYSGRRFSTLNKINDANIRSLSLAWVYRASVGGGGFGGSIKATPLLIDGVLYFTLPDQAWAIDARSGREVWHFAWESKGGIHIGSRGAAAYGDWLYFETPDCNLVSLNLRDGKKRWQTPICDLDQMYFGSVAPLVIRNHVIAGVSGDDLSTRPATLNRMIRRPERCSGAGIRTRRLASPKPRAGPASRPCCMVAA